MNYSILGTAVEITGEIRAYVEKRLASLDKFARPGARAEVELEHHAVADGPKYRAELMYIEPGAPRLRAEARGATLHEALDLAAGELLSELGRVRDKRQSVLRRSAVKVKEYLRGWRKRV